MKKTLILLCAIQALSATLGLASEEAITKEDLLEEIKALKTRVGELESKLSRRESGQSKEWGIAREEFEHTDTHILHEDEESGLKIGGVGIGAGATFVGQYAIEPNTAPGDSEVIDGTYSIDIEVESRIGKSGLVFLHLEAGEGPGLDGDEITTFSAVNRDAGDSGMDVQVTEVWYEHIFFDGRALCTAGKLDPTVYLDTNEIANDETTQFLSNTFRNSTGLEFPDDNTYGLRTALLPADWAELNVGIFDDNADWEDLSGDIFSFAQINIKPSLFSRDGNYRAYFWYDNSKHAKWIDPAANSQANFGFGTSCDQEVMDNISLFTRFGWEDPDVSVIEWAWSTGFQIGGDIWGRGNDYLGWAIGMDIPGGDYEDSGNPGDPEGHIETYYSIHINDHLQLSPDYQFIWKPNGGGNPINIISLRGQLQF
jgi:hypothetical protein